MKLCVEMSSIDIEDSVIRLIKSLDVVDCQAFDKHNYCSVGLCKAYTQIV